MNAETIHLRQQLLQDGYGWDEIVRPGGASVAIWKPLLFGARRAFSSGTQDERLTAWDRVRQWASKSRWELDSMTVQRGRTGISIAASMNRGNRVLFETRQIPFSAPFPSGFDTHVGLRRLGDETPFAVFDIHDDQPHKWTAPEGHAPVVYSGVLVFGMQSDQWCVISPTA